MTTPTARVLALLEILQSGGIRTVPELSRRLGVDERTVRRYMVQLTDLDIPVRTVRGRHGGYQLAPGYRMPPLMLTDEEAVAVMLGLAGSRATGLTATAAATESAAAKLQRVLPEALGRRLDALLTTAAFTGRARPVTAPESRVLLLIADAARNRRRVALRYTASAGNRTDRTVEPYGIVAHSGRWYLAGADSLSGQTRTFRLDRITDPQLLTDTFDVPSGFDPAARVLAGIAQAPHRHQISVWVQGTAEQVRAQLPPAVATVHDSQTGHGWVHVEIGAERLDWVPAVLAGLSLPLRIEHPAELRQLVRSLAERLAAAAEPLLDGEYRAELGR